jgi:inward rectifier potassium channel
MAGSDLGFGSKLAQKQRLLSKDGSFNVHRHTRNPLGNIHLYHLLITMSWSRFLLLIFVYYAFTNALFAALYVFVGIEHLSNPPAGFWPQFWHAYFFSAQTLTTVGYGSVSPIGLQANVIAAIEALIGLLTFALATGLLYGRFARPKARLRFSENAIIAPHRDNTNALMFRLVNVTESQIVNMEAKVFLSMIDHNQGGARIFQPLNLDISTVAMLSLSWTVVHTLTPESPLWGLSQEQLLRADAEILILLMGYDDTFAQEVNARYSYIGNEILWGHKFIPMFLNENGKTVLYLDLLNNTKIDNLY